MKRLLRSGKAFLSSFTGEFVLLGRNLGRAARHYSQIDGEQCAASFAYYAFFSLFPLILLLVVVGTFFIPNRILAARGVVQEIEQFVPLQSKDKAVLVLTINDMIQNGWRAGILGFLALVWGALRFFQALVIGINRAWGYKDYDWWKLPLKNLSMIGILISALLLGLGTPLFLSGLKTLAIIDVTRWAGSVANLLPPLILFYGLLMFYKFAPRRSPRFAHVWLPALCGTFLLELAQTVFTWYLATFTNYSAVYGVFGSIMALLLWIYFSGVILLFGGCVAATVHPTAPGSVEARLLR